MLEEYGLVVVRSSNWLTADPAKNTAATPQPYHGRILLAGLAPNRSGSERRYAKVLLLIDAAMSLPRF